MVFNKNYFILFLFFILFLSGGCVFANEIDNDNVTATQDESLVEIAEEDIFQETMNDTTGLQEVSQNSLESSSDEIIVVNDWDELQYYCAQTDKDYTLKLKENTNFYPTNPNNGAISQIKVKNNVKIIGSEGSYIGDVSPDARRIEFVAFLVEDNLKYASLNFENVTFKYIYSVYSNAAVSGTRDGIFIQMGGKKNNVFKNCIFKDILSQYGHATIVYLKKGSATLDNCSFINCTSSYGAVSVYDPNSVKSTDMVVRNCYFENNYATTEPGCINNCGKLTVYNTTFYKNRSFWWAGAIHTHAGGNTTIYDSNFTDNVAGWNGGALYTYAYLQVYNSVFVGNNCTTDNGGGAIGACSYQTDPHIYIENCLFKDNSNNCWYPDSLSDGYGRGGAISFMDAGSLEVRDTTFIANVAARGTAICAFDVATYGSPDIIIVNNSFINHTRTDDVMEVHVSGTILNVSNNYYYGNSIVFSNLTLIKLSEDKEFATLQVNASLTNPTYYDDDILNKTLYDVYINNKYVKTVNSTIFNIEFGDLDICSVYVIPTISNRKSNEVTATSTREYIFVSKSNGNDSNSGVSRELPVNSIEKALELATNFHNIILLDGDYSEENLHIDYDVTIKGEGNSTLTDVTSFISNANLTLKNLKINNLSADTFVKQNNNSLVISNCIVTNNEGLLVMNNGFTTITNSILLNNSNIIQGNGALLDYNWWGNDLPDLNIDNYLTLNITSDVSALENNQKSNVKAVFYLNDGTKYTKLPEITFNVTAINGVASQNSIAADENIVYTLTGFSDGVLTVSYNDFSASKTFEFLKSDSGISLTAEDVMVRDNLTVTVALPSDAEGNLTVNIGNVSQSKVIESSNTVFTFSNLKAGTYNVSVSYSSDKKYLSKTTGGIVNVNKYESFTDLNISTINVGEDVILTITTTDSSTGVITLSINNDTQTLALNNSQVNYTIKNIKRGDYLITAIYSGDDNYLTSQVSRFIEVDNLNATMTIQAEDITYGETAIVKVTLNDNATGSIIVTIDGVTNSSKVVGGQSEVRLSNIDAGENKNISVFYSGDDTYFNLTQSGTFSVAKADLTFTIESGDIKIGQAAEIVIEVPAKTSGTFIIGDDIVTIPLSGEITYVLADLEIGNYTYTATYNGNNYNTVSKTISFEVSEYPAPQWASEGGNTQNTHKSSYETTTNGEIAFTIAFNETLSGDIAIDSEGNIYLTTQSGIHCFNQTNRLWYFTSNDALGNLSGIAIGRDIVIAPKSGDTLYFINQTSGERYGSSNIYQGSSLFAPVIDSNANLYIASEYQRGQAGSSEGYKLVIVPYALWANGGDPTIINLDNYTPLVSPTLNEDIIVIVSEGRLRMIDAKTLQTISIKAASYQAIRPVIGDGNIVYAVLSDSIVAYNANGVQVWKSKVTGKVGRGLAIDNERAVYHINAKNLLYRYDILDGSESRVSNLKVTSGLLIGSDGTLYFGSNNVFYALDSEGNVLWKSDLESKIIGNPVMDANGLIYVPTENGITALTYAPLKDSDLKVEVDDIVEGEKATVTITWNNQTTGQLTYSLNGEDVTVDADAAKATTLISDLGIGYYDVIVSYSGDMRFKAVNLTKTFVVRSADDVANNIAFDGNSTFSFSLDNAKGNLTVNIANQTYFEDLVNGKASITVDDLAPGDYSALVIYSGDGLYNGANRTFTLSVPKFTIDLNETVTAENVIANISVALPNDAGGNLTLSVGTKKYVKEVIDGYAEIYVDDLVEGNYSCVLTYSGDNNYEGVSKSIALTLVRIPVELNDDNLVVVSPSSAPSVEINLPDDATGKLIVNVFGSDYSGDLSGGNAKVTVEDLYPGNYTATVTYSGDNRYAKASRTVNIEIPKITVNLNDLTVESNVNVPVVSIDFGNDATGILTVGVNDENFTGEVINGVSSITIPGLIPDTYDATVTYSGDDIYAGASKQVTFTVSKIILDLNDTTLTVLKDDNSVNFTVSFTSDVTGEIIVSIGDVNYTETLNEGKATVEVKDLSAGNYEALVSYSGDVYYQSASKISRFSVSMIDVILDESNLIVENLTVSLMLGNDFKGNLSVIVSDKVFEKALVNGSASITVEGLSPGSYDASVVYSGDDKHSVASKDIVLNVSKIESTLDNLVVISNVAVPSVSIDFGNDATGEISVSVGGKIYISDVVDGICIINITGLNPGNYNATVTYSGDNNYTGAINEIVLNVSKIESTLDNLVVISNVAVPSVSIDFGNDATGEISVSVGGKIYISDVVDGICIINITGLDPGNYNATVTYSGDNKYSDASDEIVIEVPKVQTVLDNETLSINSDTNVSSFAIDLPSDATGTLTVVVNNSTYTEELVNGSAVISIDDLNPGDYEASVIYSGDSKYGSISKVVSVNVPKVETVLDDNTLNVDSNSSSYSISLPDDATGIFTVTVDGVDYSAQLVNGKATVNIHELGEGTHNITVAYSGDSKYSSIVKSSVVNVNKTVVKADPILVVVADDINVGDNAIINVKASFGSGNVTVNVNNNDYELIITNGEASLNISDLPAGNYTLLVNFAGDDEFNPVSNSTAFSVLKLSVNASDETLTVPEGDATSYSISLPGDATGTLTVTVDGVNYTESLVNGKATVNIPALSTGTHNITVTYSGDSKYSSIVKSCLVTKDPVIKLTGSNLKMLYTSGKYFKVRLTSDGQALSGVTVKITINGKTYTKTTNNNGYASLKITLAPKTYAVKAAYGDLSITKKVVVKSIIKAKNVKVKKSAKSVKIKVTLKKVNGKYLKKKKVTLKFNKKTYKVKTNKKGVATFTIKKKAYTKLKTGKKYTYKVIYGKNKVKKTIKFKK